MTSPPPEDEPVDGSDEADHDAMEIAIGAVIAALLIAWLLPGLPSIFGMTRAVRRAQLEARLGPVLRSFIERSASDLAAASGQPGAHVAAAEAVPSVYEHAIDLASEWTEQSYHRILHDPRREAPTPDAPDPTPDLAQTAGEQNARAVAAAAKNEARDETAGRIGALWSIWRTRGDSKVRETHAELDHHKVPYGGLFVVDGGRAYLRRPGDPKAPPSETMGCRCRLQYRFRPKETTLADV